MSNEACRRRSTATYESRHENVDEALDDWKEVVKVSYFNFFYEEACGQLQLLQTEISDEYLNSIGRFVIGGISFSS